MNTSSATGVPHLDRAHLDRSPTITRIGDGSLGGKASSLQLVQTSVLGAFEAEAFPGFDIDVPIMTVITTDVFDAFMAHNRLAPIAFSDEPDDRIAHAFQQSQFPAAFVGDLRALLGQRRVPLAVRSSSLLEDDLHHPFAGVYGTKMIPNNQADTDTRFRKLVEAIKFVYASTFFRSAKAYAASVDQDIEREKMAVIVQDLVGRRIGERYYPTLSGVARSFNYYPTGRAKRSREWSTWLLAWVRPSSTAGCRGPTPLPIHRSRPPWAAFASCSRTLRIDSGRSTWAGRRSRIPCRRRNTWFTPS